MPDDNSKLERLAESVKNGSVEAHRLSVAHRSSDSARLTWYAAICGYVLVNSVPFVDKYLPGLSSPELASLLLPWAVSGLLAVAGHLALAHAAGREDAFHFRKLTMLDMNILGAATGSLDAKGLAAILETTEVNLAIANNEMLRATKLRTRMVAAAQWALLITFAWSIASIVFSPCLFY